MNASHFLDLIQRGRSSTESGLDKVCEQYPYFALAQLTRYKQDPHNQENSLPKAALYKQDEWLFAQWYSTPTDKQVNHEEETIGDIEVEELVETMDQTPPHDLVEEVKVAEEVVHTPTEDVLSLISELPNSNPIAEAKHEASAAIEIVPTQPLSLNKEVSDDPEKSLMVMMSFTDWLNYFKTKKQKEDEEERDKKALKTHWQKEKLAAAVEEDVDEIPEPIFKQAMDSISSESGIISESLAKILANQGKIDKAIDMYKKLSLRNPEKRSYFADLIENLNSKRD